jgi:hypothetical protein
LDQTIQTVLQFIFDFIPANSRARETALLLHDFVFGPTKFMEYVNHLSHSGFKMFNVLKGDKLAKQT